MNNQRVLVSCCVALLTASVFVLRWNDVGAQQAASSDNANNPGAVTAEGNDEKAKQAARLAEMELAVGRLSVFETLGDQRQPVEIVEKPLLHFNDQVRRHLDGTFWVWGRTGRPVATGEIWSNHPEKHLWYVALASTTTNLAGCELDEQPSWSSKTAGVSFTKLPSNASPATAATRMQTQMRSLARRFTVSNTQLRTLARPVHTYRDRKKGLLAGAMFVIAHGTNPEITLLIEAVQEDSGAGWQYALARSSSGPLEVRLDGKPIWSVPAAEPVTGLPDDPYRIIELKPKSDQ